MFTRVEEVTLWNEFVKAQMQGGVVGTTTSLHQVFKWADQAVLAAKERALGGINNNQHHDGMPCP